MKYLDDFKAIFELLLKNYKKEFVFWVVSTFLFVFSLGFAMFEGLRFWQLKNVETQILAYESSILSQAPKIEKFKKTFKELSKKELKKVEVKGQLELTDLGKVVSFFKSMYDINREEFFVLKAAIKDKNTLRFAGEKVYIKEVVK
ncbi:MAG: hypothetical protein GXO57_01880 [Thermodesulfobacteria bacterium]|nr:hypothetical protein [Thermodesulfobacteriota bacterium]